MSRVLVVDDDDEIVVMLRTVSRFCNWQWEFARNGLEALHCYDTARHEGAPYDLIILDIAMPDMTGLEVARSIRNGGDDNTKIIFYSAYDGVVNRQTAEDLNGVYVQKVVRPQVLADIADQLIAGTYKPETI